MRNPVDLPHLFADINLLAVHQQMDAIPLQEGGFWTAMEDVRPRYQKL